MLNIEKQSITEQEAMDIFFNLLNESYQDIFNDFHKHLDPFHDLEIQNEQIAKMSFLLMLAVLEIECIRNIYSEKFADQMYHYFLQKLLEILENKFNEIQAERYRDIIHNELADYKQKYHESLTQNKRNPCYSLLENVVDKHLHATFKEHTPKIYLEETNTINPIINKLSSDFLTDSIYISKKIFSENEIN